MLYHLHSGIRYLVLLCGVAVILYALRGVALKKPHDATMKRLALSFSGLMDLNVLVGVLLVMTGFGFYNDLGVHVVLMVLAAAVSHVVPSVMKRRKPEDRTVLPYAVGAAVALVLVALAIASIGRPIVG